MDADRSGPSEDPAPDTSHTLGGRLLTVFGIVTDYTGGLQLYRVKISDTDEIPATALTEGGGLYGVRTNAVYPLNTPVVVLLLRSTTEDSAWGVILGAVPRQIACEALYQADIDVAGWFGGWMSDEIHRWEAVQRPAESARKNFNSYVPIDSLTGEWGAYSPLGPGLHLGLALAYLRATDRCGIWAVRQDEMLRLMAKNHEVQTMGRDYADTCASGEVLTVDDRALYPWEGLGAFSPQAIAEQDEEADPYAEGAEDRQMPLSPVEDRQRGIFRLRQLTGYAADVRQEFLSLPLGEGIDSYGQNEDRFPGVFRQALGPDGSLIIQSAKSLAFEKYLSIPYPVEIRKPSDPEGDLKPVEEDGEPYYASGYYPILSQEEEAPEPVRKDWQPKEDEERPGLRGMTGLELHGFRAVETIKNLLLHKKNWRVPEENESPWAGGPLINVGQEFELDPDRQWMPLPRVVEERVDHRMTTKFFASRAGVYVDDDGTIRIEDGYGSQLLMSGGNIYMSCPGDILRSAGRSIYDLAPKDICQRAGRDIDITSSYGDLRFKAEYNLIAIGANAGDRGGVLVESRNTESRSNFSYVPGTETDIQGLVLSNQRGAVSVVGRDVALVSGYYQEQDTDSRLVLQTRGDIHQIANGAQIDVRRSLDLLVGGREEGVDDVEELLDRSLYRFTSGAASFVSSGDNQLPSLAVGGSVVAGSLVSTGVGELEFAELREILDSARDTAVDQASDVYQALIDARASSRRDETTQTSFDNYLNALATSGVLGSLRTEADYGTDDQDFRLFEFLWQQMARAAGGYEDRIWTEPPVSFDLGDEPVSTGPWPGYGPWTEESRMLRIKDRPENYFDLTAGRARPYDQEVDGAEAAHRPEVEERQLSDSFLVNYKPTSR